LERGGAHIHMFEGLLSFLCIPYLVITDLDSVEPTGHHQACRADFAGAVTANATLKKFCEKTTVEDLMAVKPEDKKNALKDRCIAFQHDITVTEGTATLKLRPRTFEEAIAYQNFALLRSNVIPLGNSISTNLDSAYGDIYSRIHSPSFKKTDFAMTLLGLTEDWQTPNYIVSGLQWLESRLSKLASQ
jgi:putative ATP-dependent endonuclease of OLD family